MGRRTVREKVGKRYAGEGEGEMKVSEKKRRTHIYTRGFHRDEMENVELKCDGEREGTYR